MQKIYKISINYTLIVFTQTQLVFFSCSLRNKEQQVLHLGYKYFPPSCVTFISFMYLHWEEWFNKTDGSVRVQSRSVNQYLDHWWALLSFWALLSISWWMSCSSGHHHIIITQKTFWTSGYKVRLTVPPCISDISLYEI